MNKVILFSLLFLAGLLSIGACVGAGFMFYYSKHVRFCRDLSVGGKLTCDSSSVFIYKQCETACGCIDAMMEPTCKDLSKGSASTSLIGGGVGVLIAGLTGLVSVIYYLIAERKSIFA
jgi:hypothetical protein